MRHSLKSAIALLAVSALPLIAVAPASALSPALDEATFDCEANNWNYNENDMLDLWGFTPLTGETKTLHLVHCDGWWIGDYDSTAAASIGVDAIDSTGLAITDSTVDVTIDDEVSLDFFSDENEMWNESFDYWVGHIEVTNPYSMADPEGVRLVEETETVFAEETLNTFSAGSEDEILNRAEYAIDGNSDCYVVAGDHIYTTQKFTVKTAGTFTFRTLGSEPTSDYITNGTGSTNPLRDPMVALYTSFSPDDVDSNVVGCNDDLNDQVIGDHDFGDLPYNSDSLGNVFDGHNSYFVVDLEPGVYTMVFTTWDFVSTSDFSSGTSDSIWLEDWTPGDISLYFDVWGPEGGLELGDTLAATGVDPSFGLWTGLALAGTGVAITVARRRAQRA